ncbi:disulfide oxidoreductase [Gorillibacterium sp. sgz5001074]|uniref:disulfide oxidoreductase n=1 Tax=Gorillibacterium sp. sgz5001074 TaxID=3446695 RepID=UPI003F67BBA8
MSTKFTKENSLFLAWVVAVTATLGSLYFSEIMQYIPCKLCWIQRIFMYPLAILLGIATVKKDYKITGYVLSLTIPGGLVSLYHYLYEKTDWFHAASNFCGENPCDIEYINWFGFVTIPFLALVAFILITVAMIMLRRVQNRWN